MRSVVFCDLVGSTGLFERLGDEAASRFVTQLMAALAQTFAAHRGRVVKTLGDGVFVVFAAPTDAVAACVAIQRQLHESPIIPGGHGKAVALQMGIESGEIVDIDGDCYGDAVNCAARLADLAGGDQILTTERVRGEIPTASGHSLRSLGPIFLRGKGEATPVWRVHWQRDKDIDATVMSSGAFKSYAPGSLATRALEVVHVAQVAKVRLPDERLVLGRSQSAGLPVSDPRVSRVHATIEARGNQFVLIDTSSFGTWVYMGAQAEPLVLRRSECVLVGEGEFTLGCERVAENPPTVSFAVR